MVLLAVSGVQEATPTDAALALGVRHSRVDARAAEADERLHVVLAGGLREAPERRAVARAARHRRVLAASPCHGLLVDALQRVLREGLRHVPRDELELFRVFFLDVLVEIALGAASGGPRAVLEGAEGPRPSLAHTHVVDGGLWRHQRLLS